MRIAICTDFYPPQLSGVADSVAILATELKKRGHAVRVYAPSVPGSLPDPSVMHLPSCAIPGSNGVMALVVPLGGMKDLRRFKPDIIHIHTLSTAGFLGIWASWRLRAPLFGTDHTLPAHYLHYAHLDCRPFRFLVKKFSAWCYGRCAFVTAPSSAMIDELKAYGMKRPARVISNSIPWSLFRPLAGKDALKKRYGIGERAVLIFGRIAIEKNLEVALNVYKKTTAAIDADLVFIGDGPYREEMERMVRENGLERRVHFLGTLRGEALVEAINACDVFLITSLSETQSMTTLQAMACGLPVVVANAGGVPEYVEEGTTGYIVAPERGNLFAEKLITLLSDQKLAQRMGEAGRASIERFSPGQISGEFEALYSACITQGRKT